MDVIAEIRARLRGYPQLRVEETPASIEVAAPHEGGFPVALTREGSGYVVHFAGWHEHFDSPREALSCFSYGLHGACRLRVSCRGATAHRWILEAQRDGQWVEESRTGLLLFPFWRRPRTLFLVNQVERPRA